MRTHIDNKIERKRQLALIFMDRINDAGVRRQFKLTDIKKQQSNYYN